MICPQCNNGILSPSFPKPLVVTYRGFSKQVGTLVALECSSCLYESPNSLESIVDIDKELSDFKREINVKLSIGDDL